MWGTGSGRQATNRRLLPFPALLFFTPSAHHAHQVQRPRSACGTLCQGALVALLLPLPRRLAARCPAASCCWDDRPSLPPSSLSPPTQAQFTATIAGSVLRRPKASTATPAQRWLMSAIGALDASAYTLYCLGFYRLGATGANLVRRQGCARGARGVGRGHAPQEHRTTAACIAALSPSPRSPVSLPQQVLSGVGQVLTALFTRFLLRKRLTNGQLGGILFVGLGLAARSAPASYFEASSSASSGSASGAPSAAAALALSQDQLVGAAFVAASALLYSLLGVAYERLLKVSLGGRNKVGWPACQGCSCAPNTAPVDAAPCAAPAPRSPRLACVQGPEPAPPNAEIQYHTSVLGFLAAVAYQALFTLPRYDSLVQQHLDAAAAAGSSARYVAGLLLLFGALFNGHQLIQAAVFKTEGAIGVVRCCTFCSPDCLLAAWRSAPAAAAIACGPASQPCPPPARPPHAPPPHPCCRAW